jgi:hypothetical protein
LRVKVGGFLLPGSFLAGDARYRPPFLSLPLFPRNNAAELLVAWCDDCEPPPLACTALDGAKASQIAVRDHNSFDMTALLFLEASPPLSL